MKDHSLEAARLDALDALRKAATTPGDAFRTPVLTSVDANGHPQARTVVLRAFDPGSMVLTIYTDKRSPKLGQLRANPQVQLLFYDAGRKVQIRATGVASVHFQDAITSAQWKNVPEYGRDDYLSRRPPGAEINDPSEGWQSEAEFGAANFCVIRIRIDHIDWLKLSSSGHKRAYLIWQDGQYHGRWITP